MFLSWPVGNSWKVGRVEPIEPTLRRSCPRHTERISPILLKVGFCRKELVRSSLMFLGFIEANHPDLGPRSFALDIVDVD